MPAWLRQPLAEQPLWEWIGFVLVLAPFILFVPVPNRVLRLGRARSPLLYALAQLAVPGLIFAATLVIAYLVQVELNLIGRVGSR